MKIGMYLKVLINHCPELPSVNSSDHCPQKISDNVIVLVLVH